MEPSGSTSNDTTVGKSDGYDPRSLLPGIMVEMRFLRVPDTKKQRRRWRKMLRALRITVSADGAGTLLDLTAFDLYLQSLLRWAPSDPTQPPPPAL